MKTWLKKRKKYIGRGAHDKLKNLEKNRVKITFSHLVRERYPDFEDAIRNLNDPLSMVNLFALVKAKKVSATSKPKQVRRFIQLAKEFHYYIVQTRALRKAFVSIKGIYYEAVIKGQSVLWLVPHKFVQFTPRDVDYRVMGTFLQFYETMLKFVNYKLYITENLMYPPKFVVGEKSLQVANKPKAKKAEAEAKKEPKKAEAEKEPKKIENLEKIIEKADSTGKSEGEEIDVEVEAPKKFFDKRCTLFKGLVFLLNRETPQEALEFVVTAMGGNCVWQQATRTTGVPKTVTHQVIDRNPPKGEPPVWEMIQPQWVFDCLNVGVRIPVGPYAPGKICPPHLSPFQSEDSAYEPKQAAVLREWAKMGGAELEELEQAAEIEEKVEEGVPEIDGQEVVDAADDEEGLKVKGKGEDEEDKDEDKEQDKGEQVKKRKREDADEEEPAAKPSHPAKKKRTEPAKKKKKPKRIRRRDIDAIPHLEDRKKLLPRKHRYLFHLIEKSNKQWHEEGDVLRRKRELLENESSEKNEVEEKNKVVEKELEKDLPEKESAKTESTEV